MQLGQDLWLEQIRAQMPTPLTWQELLSQVSGLYDHVSLATHARQKAAILVRRAFREAKDTNKQVRDTWDRALSDNLKENAIKIFEDFTELRKIKFTRALTAVQSGGDPLAVTFSDGSKHAYETLLYLR